MRPVLGESNGEVRAARGKRQVEAKQAKGEREPIYNTRPTQDRTVESGSKTK